MPSFEELRAADVRRCNETFHPGGSMNDWSPTDWACALAGEVGEACNLIKKLRRLQTAPHWSPGDAELPLVAMIADELADTAIYLDLLAARLGIDLGAAIVKKFDEVSEKVGSKVRLARPPRYPSWEDDPDVVGA